MKHSLSVAITDVPLINAFLRNPNFPFLISFPRTGSHWLRCIMELYFKKPSLQRAFFYTDAKEFTCFHSHDMNLSIERENVIYLYRDPIETIYSQLKYYDQDITDISNIVYWSEAYNQHLRKWLNKPSFVKKQTIITYEEMKDSLEVAFSKVCTHFGVQLELNKLQEASKMVTKDLIKNKTSHDSKVINFTSKYEDEKILFKDSFGGVIESIVTAFPKNTLK